MSRLIRILNILIALVLILGLAVVYWFAWRPLPQRSGTISAQLQSPVTVSFDSLGEPHIRAAGLDDALFVQGYVTAQDRLWQMDGLRRLVAGDLSEVVGPAALESDRESRRLRLRRLAEQAYTTLPQPDRAALAAYARGVNAFIDSHRGSLPLEFTLLQYQPRPWSVVDSLLISLHMFRTLTTSWRDDLLKRAMLAQGDARKVNFLFPIRSGTEPMPGSNAWVMAGSHTASGKPLLSNDPHLEYGLPGIWYMTHLQAPGLDAAGVSIPGLPGVIIGHNQRIAWGMTNLEFDVQDLYLEKFDDRTGRYLFRGQTLQARRDVELIRIKGQPAEEMQIWVTVHGPIFAAEGSERMALHWMAAEPGLLQYPVLDLDRAGNWQQFTAALARYPGPAQNFVYADVDGNIGYHAAGQLPVRRGFSGDVPVDSASGDFEWQGVIPFDQLPSAFNPPGGIIATANQDPFPAAYPYTVNGTFAPPYRVNQIRALLSTHQSWRAEQMLAVQKDVYSPFGKFLAGQLVAAYDNRRMKNPALEDAVALLRGWNGQMDKNLAAPFLISLAFQHARTALAENAAPGASVNYDFPMASAAIEKLLRERPAGWFDDYDAMLLRVLVDSVEEGQRIQGRDVRRWQYGLTWRVTVAHPVTHQIPWIGKYFDIGPVPMSGSSLTVKQTTLRIAPSMRMNADLSDWDRSLLNILTGQSGHVLSSHYRDQWPAYYVGRSYPMQFRTVKASSTLVFRP
ncbi:MAG TPA: penicillin acylase family protein [Bryobacteraceae bacterium]|nr:penicillin acylase family protein [Bryobacteraceae bacterium]